MLGEMSQSDRDRYRAASRTRGTSKTTHRKEIRAVVTGRGAGEGGGGSRRRLHGRVSPGDAVHSAGAAASVPCDVRGAVKGADPERPPQRERRPSSSSPSWGDGETCPCCANDVTAHEHAPHHELAQRRMSTTSQ